MELQAAVTETRGAPFVIQNLEASDLEPGEVLVAVKAAGICHTDLIVRDQWYPVPLPAVLGHEGAGVVEQVGAGVAKVAVGDRVAMSFDSCGACPTCQTGRPSYCHDFFARNFGASRPDGSTSLSRGGQAIHSHFFGQSSFATHAVARERNIVKLADDVPFSLVAPFGCGVQTGAGGVLNALRAEAGSTIAVFGTGTVGLAAVMAAQVAGCTTIVGIDTRADRLDLARELGATHTVNATDGDVVDAVTRITGYGVDYSVESTGVPEVLRMAVDALAPTGSCALIGAPAFGTEVSLDVNTLLVAGRGVRGVVEGDSVPDIFIPRLLDLWRQGRFPADRLTRSYPFDNINQAAEDAEQGRVVKAVLEI